MVKQDRVWDKAKPIRGKDPDKYRQDPYGNQMFKDSYGRDSEMGWHLDHINPKSQGGSDSVRNLQAMNSSKNRSLGDTTRKRSRHNQR